MKYLIILIFIILVSITAVSAEDNHTIISTSDDGDALSQNADEVKLEKTYYYPNSKDRYVDDSVVTHNVVKYYGDSEKKFKVVVYDKDKNPQSGVKVSLIKDAKYTKRTTNSKGVAYFPLNYKPGTYDVETYIEDDNGFFSAYNTVKVKSTIPVSELVKYSTSKKKFQIKFLDSKGKALKNTRVEVKIKGKIHKLKTNSRGIVKIKSTRFKIGKDKIVAYNPASGETRKIPVFVLEKGMHKINIRIDDPTGYYPTKKLKNGDSISTEYESRQGRQNSPGVYIWAISKGLEGAKHTKLIKAKIFFKNKYTGKVITKTLSKLVDHTTFIQKPVKGYSPYKATVWYRDK